MDNALVRNMHTLLRAGEDLGYSFTPLSLTLPPSSVYCLDDAIQTYKREIKDAYSKSLSNKDTMLFETDWVFSGFVREQNVRQCGTPYKYLWKKVLENKEKKRIVFFYRGGTIIIQRDDPTHFQAIIRGLTHCKNEDKCQVCWNDLGGDTIRLCAVCGYVLCFDCEMKLPKYTCPQCARHFEYHKTLEELHGDGEDIVQYQPSETDPDYETETEADSESYYSSDDDVSSQE
jgi:hypothetical protein